MDEFNLIKNYFQKLTKDNTAALKLNDDVFFDKKKTCCNICRYLQYGYTFS